MVNASPEETRIALIEDGKVAEIQVERATDRSLVGNIYLGRVDRVLPGMQSAFVDIGLARHAFIHVADVVPESEQDDERPAGAVPRGREARAADQAIEKLLTRGQDIVVQVTREPFAQKGARLTTHLSLPGKYVVFLPLSDHLGVSKRIPDEAQRDGLRSRMEILRTRHGGGLIARTDAATHPPESIDAEVERLAASWAAIKERITRIQPPARVHEEPGLAVRILRDQVAAQVSRIVVDDDATREEILDFAAHHAPDLVALVHRHSEPTGLFESMGLEQEIEKALRDRVWLRSGGYLVIDQLEALVAIDVNTGKYTGAKRLEDTVVRTNLEAAREVARQLRLRDLGGIIVVDFIDMVEPEHRKSVLSELESAFTRDRARTTVLGMSEFGLVEITRQRQKRSLERTLMDHCPSCGGAGRVKSAETVAHAVLRRIRSMAAGDPHLSRVVVRAHPEVGERLRATERDLLAAGTPLPVRLEVTDDPTRHREAFELTS